MQACSFSRLPEPLLAHILQALPQQDRLTSCASVCTSWAAAATAVTVAVDVDHLCQSPVATAALQAWLQRHAGQLGSLKVTPSFGARKFCLNPGELQHLTKLELRGCELQLDTPSEGGHNSSSKQYPAGVLPNLKVLKLLGCYLRSSTVLQLLQLPGVTCLKLSEPWERQCSPDEATAIRRLLRRLPNLARLSFPDVGDIADITSALAPSSLTALTLHPGFAGNAQMPSTEGNFLSTPPFAHLQQLKLLYVPFNPKVLSSTPLLTRLQLTQCQLRPKNRSLFFQTGPFVDKTPVGGHGAVFSAVHTHENMAAPAPCRRAQNMGRHGSCFEPETTLGHGPCFCDRNRFGPKPENTGWRWLLFRLLLCMIWTQSDITNSCQSLSITPLHSQTS
jgi:hypothetical protein